MNSTGEIIRALRNERGFTQRELAQEIGVSDKAVSKWERGLGLPDVGLMAPLSAALGVETSALLEGSFPQNEGVNGNMKKLKFYRCPVCGNIITSSGTAKVSCCSRTLDALIPAEPDAAHLPTAEPVENEWYITIPHEMTKSAYIAFVAYLTGDSLVLKKLYAEQDAALRMPRGGAGRGELYVCCTEHGLFRVKL